jgi:hypothetical protein
MTDRTPPFNTGKVLIGSRYEPPRDWHPSRDAYDLQTGLLEASGHTAAVPDPWPVRLYCWFRTVMCGKGQL